MDRAQYRWTLCDRATSRARCHEAGLSRRRSAFRNADRACVARRGRRDRPDDGRALLAGGQGRRRFCARRTRCGCSTRASSPTEDAVSRDRSGARARARRALRRGPVGPAAATRWKPEVLVALSEAHSRGIFHRDVKPEDVLLAPAEHGEVAKLTDFGLAKIWTARWKGRCSCVPRKRGARHAGIHGARTVAGRDDRRTYGRVLRRDHAVRAGGRTRAVRIEARACIVRRASHARAACVSAASRRAGAQARVGGAASVGQGSSRSVRDRRPDAGGA